MSKTSNVQSPRVLIKLGGAALDGERTLQATTEAIQSYRKLGYSVILVHGGGPAINAELTRRGITWNFINGQRVTTPEMIQVIDETLFGTVNRRLVHHFLNEGMAVAGMSGAEHQTLLCTKASQELGQVGKIQKVNTSWIEQILGLENGVVPVVAPLGVGLDGQRFNINADQAAGHLAVALQVEQLVFLTDQPGILDEEGEIISTVSATGLENMMEFKVVSGGMLAKTQAILHALNNGISTVRVMKAADAAHASSNATLGTMCRLTLKPVVSRRKVQEAQESYAAV